jgi:hypothetical protein
MEFLAQVGWGEVYESQSPNECITTHRHAPRRRGRGTSGRVFDGNSDLDWNLGRLSGIGDMVKIPNGTASQE